MRADALGADKLVGVARAGQPVQQHTRLTHKVFAARTVGRARVGIRDHAAEEVQLQRLVYADILVCNAERNL